MVKQVKAASHKTSEVITRAFEVLMLVATATAGVTAVTQHTVHTIHGNLPIFQVVGGLVLSGVAHKLYTLQK